MRICILTQADSLAWTQHYVDAFRARAEVLTVGPGLAAEELKAWGIDPFADTLIPNDIEVPLLQDLDLRTVLPAGWEPDLVVGISKGGMALRPLANTLACPTAYISVDTWQSPGDYVDAQCYDFTFAAQQGFVDRLRASGASNVHWLPLACNPAAHYSVDLEPEADISFAGNIVLPAHQRRHALLARLKERFSTLIETRVFHRRACETVARGRLAFNRSAIDDVNMRVFEVMAMGRPLLTNRDAERNGLFDLFEAGTHLIAYNDENDIVDEAERYLQDEDARERIACTAHETVMAHHTYGHRVDTMLGILRERIPGFGASEVRASTELGNPFANQVPYGARQVVDFGLQLKGLRGAVLTRGTERLVGVADDGIDASAQGTYCEVVRHADGTALPRDADAVVLPTTAMLGADTKTALRKARSLLGPGGTLIVRLDADDVATGLGAADLHALERRLVECGLHINWGVVENRPEGDSVLIRARKRTRQLKSIFESGFTHFPEIDTSHFSQWIAALGPDY